MRTNILQAKKALLALFAMLMPLLASAQSGIDINGIRYRLVSKSKQAEVTYNSISYQYSNNYSGAITIPATVSYNDVLYNVTSVGEGAFYACYNLTSIILPESVTSIGEYAFSSCSSLTSITIPRGVTSIGESAFSNCKELTSITIPENSQLTSIGEYAFSSCSSLTSITIPRGVTSIEQWAFYGCSSLTSITIPESATSIGKGAFSDCKELTSITVAEGNTIYDSRVGCNAIIETNSNTLIQGCSTTIIPENVTSFGDYAFYDCRNLTSVAIPSSVTSIGHYAFEGCYSLTTITIPENSQLTSIGEGAFRYCSRLTSITIPRGVTSIEQWAFYGCYKLTNIVLPNNLKYIKYNAFVNCTELTNVYCYNKKVPSTNSYAFDGSYPESATLHVPASALNAYKTTAPWSSFGKFETFEITVENITLNQSTATLTEGEVLTLTAMVTPDDAVDKSITWSSSNPSVASVDNTGKVTAIASGTATITAKANDGSGVSAQCEVTVTPASYVITFLIDGEQFYTQTLTRGSTITLPEAPTKEGHTFSGWSEVPETMPAKDVTVSGTFIVNKYVVNFKVGDEVIASESLEYGASIVAPEAPEKVGYTFNGWGEVAETVPAHDVTYEGSYSINSYTLTYVVDGEAVLTLPILYGGSIPSLKVPAKEGYTFSGWSEIPETMPANDVIIEGTFTQLPSVYLTINQADNGNVKQHLTTGTICTFTIVAAEGWTIHSVTFNGEEVTAQLTEEGTFTTPALQADAVLNIAYERVNSAISNAKASRIKVQSHRGILRITGATEGDDISVYTTDGILVAQQQSSAGEAKFTVDTNQVYLVHIGDKVVKIGM